MKGFDYTTDKPVNKSIREWRSLAGEVIRKGGFVREDRDLGETFIHKSVRVFGGPSLVAEIYGINLNLETNK